METTLSPSFTGSHLGPERPTTGAAEGSPSAHAEFEDFYRAEVRKVVAFLLSMNASHEEAADAAQEAMLHAFKRWDSIHQPTAYVRKVAARILLKARHDWARPLLLAFDEGYNTEFAAPHDEMLVAEDMLVIRDAIRQLPARQRQVLALTVDDYTPQEIAQELGLSPESVRSNLRHARRTIMQLWAALTERSA